MLQLAWEPGTQTITLTKALATDIHTEFPANQTKKKTMQLVVILCLTLAYVFAGSARSKSPRIDEILEKMKTAPLEAADAKIQSKRSNHAPIPRKNVLDGSTHVYMRVCPSV